MKSDQMKTVVEWRQCRSEVFFVKSEHVLYFVLISDFEQTNVCLVHIENTNTLEGEIRNIVRYVVVFSVWTNFLTNSMYTNSIATLWLDQWEILAKAFTSDTDSGHKDAGQIQNDLLYFCIFIDFARWKTNYLCDFVVRDINIAPYQESPRKWILI